MSRVHRANLTDFRNYQRLIFAPGPHLNVVTGSNGSGKTNLLEALSLLVPGRGLRAARPETLARLGTDCWAVAAQLLCGGGSHQVGTGTMGRAVEATQQSRGRTFRLDGAPVRSQLDIASLLSIIWLTPQMERLFGEAASGRRRFLDRLVGDIDAIHPRTIAAHDAAIASRNRLLIERHSDSAWLSATEDAIARHATTATAARLGFCRRINSLASYRDDPQFPNSQLILQCPIASRLTLEPARLVEDWLRNSLAKARSGDARHAVTSIGAHRADLVVEEHVTRLPAQLASTGQQKSMLVGIILTHASLIEADRGEAPLLLLDEPLVHLDHSRRESLFARLLSMSSQAMLTGADETAFAPLKGKAAFWRAAGNAVTALH